MKWPIAVGLAAVILAGCHSQSASVPATAPKASVSVAEATLAAAGRTVVACYAVPACATVAPKSDIKRAYDGAYAAVTEAQTAADSGGSPDMTASVAALSALETLLTRLPRT